MIGLTGHKHTETIKYSPVVCCLLEPLLQWKWNVIRQILGFIHFRHFQSWFRQAAWNLIARTWNHMKWMSRLTLQSSPMAFRSITTGHRAVVGRWRTKLLTPVWRSQRFQSTCERGSSSTHSGCLSFPYLPSSKIDCISIKFGACCFSGSFRSNEMALEIKY